jgi:hypothetical protein
MDGGQLFAKTDSATTRNDKFDAVLKRFLSNYGSEKMELRYFTQHETAKE